jgi:predicted DNA-binding transcriptional regulator YafY
VLAARRLDILYPCDPSCSHIPRARWKSVEPYGLVFKGISRRYVRTGIWYLVAYCLSCERFLTFRVSAIEDLRMREERITFDPDFDLRAYWQEARKHSEESQQPYTVKLRVRPPARYGLKGNFALVNEKADGSAIVRVEVESLEEAISYVLALGADATVIYPAQVRAAVAATAQAIAELYDQLPM